VLHMSGFAARPKPLREAGRTGVRQAPKSPVCGLDRMAQHIGGAIGSNLGEPVIRTETDRTRDNRIDKRRLSNR
jgi:hypothetical protein